jgi:hypothetical protein
MSIAGVAKIQNFAIDNLHVHTTTKLGQPASGAVSLLSVLLGFIERATTEASF